jgi:hypothetical protein
MIQMFANDMLTQQFAATRMAEWLDDAARERLVDGRADHRTQDAPRGHRAWPAALAMMIRGLRHPEDDHAARARA